MGRTEADREITSEPWLSTQSSTEQIRPLFGVSGVVCPKKEKRRQKNSKTILPEPTLLEITGYATTQELTSAEDSGIPCRGSYWLRLFTN